MNYSIDKSTLRGLIDTEVALVADEAYAEDGTSLYDTVVLTSKDDGTVDNLIDEAVGQFVKTASDIASLSSNSITITAADMASGQDTAAQDEIRRFIVLSVCAAIFQKRRPILVPEYSGRAQAALENAIAIIRKRTAPSRT